MEPGGDLDLRGATVDPATWEAVRAGAVDAAGVVRLGRCRFDGAVLDCADFHGVVFEGDASFAGAQFRRAASFRDAVFHGNAGFHEAVFNRGATYDGAVFDRHADFTCARFNADALFTGVRWKADVTFTGAWFLGAADFDCSSCGRDVLAQETRFSSPLSWRNGSVARHLLLDRALFRDCAWLGPLTVGARLSLNSARASRTLRLTATAQRVSIRNAILHTTRLHTPADLSHTSATELQLHGAGPLTLTGAVAASTRLTGVDLGTCVFESAKLSGLALRGCRFPGRLAEEPAPWTAALYQSFAEATDDPEQARLFHIRAIEMRRLAHPSPWWRLLLTLCRVTSGYGRSPLRIHTTFAALALTATLLTALGLESGELATLAHR